MFEKSWMNESDRNEIMEGHSNKIFALPISARQCFSNSRRFSTVAHLRLQTYIERSLQNPFILALFASAIILLSKLMWH